eukprot:6214339-Pleurochrysis_carterae.AAC.4
MHARAHDHACEGAWLRVRCLRKPRARVSTVCGVRERACGRARACARVCADACACGCRGPCLNSWQKLCERALERSRRVSCPCKQKPRGNTRGLEQLIRQKLRTRIAPANGSTEAHFEDVAAANALGHAHRVAVTRSADLVQMVSNGGRQPLTTRCTRLTLSLGADVLRNLAVDLVVDLAVGGDDDDVAGARVWRAAHAHRRPHRVRGQRNHRE